MRRFGLVIGFLLWGVVAWGLPGDPQGSAEVDSGETTVTLTRPAAGKSLTCDTTVLTIAWTSNSSGTCTALIADVYGIIERVTIIPDDSSTVTTPTNLYDMTLKDLDGIDVLIGHGANLSTTTATSFASMVEETTSDGCMPTAVLGTLNLDVTNAGDEKSGWVRLYLYP